MFLAWKDKRIVSLLSTWNDTGMVDSARILRGGKDVTLGNLMQLPATQLPWAALIEPINTHPRTVFYEDPLSGGGKCFSGAWWCLSLTPIFYIKL